MIGEKVSHYTVLSKLGSGGMGEVYLAEDSALERKVALKVLPATTQHDPVARRAVIQEAKAAAAIDHPFVCKIYEVGESGGRVFISMEYVRGEMLYTRLRAATLPLKVAVQIATEIVEALAKAHENRVVHRDLKPGNIMLTPEGHVKVMDFGLAQRLPHGNEPQETLSGAGSGSWSGTPGYMAPEQIRGLPTDARGDLFAFGIVFYELLTRVHPFQRANNILTTTAILTEAPTPLRRHLRNYPPLLDPMIEKALAKLPAGRYQSAAEILADLRRLEDDLVTPPSATRPENVTVAVLPFENLSADKENEYFSDGITEEIIAQISRIPGLTTISRRSVMRYKGVCKTPQEIARELKVDAVLEGSVRRAGNRVRIQSGLVDVETDRQLWTETYDRQMTDIFEIQSEVSQKIAEILRANLSPAQRELLEPPTLQDLTAYHFYLKGRYFLNRFTADGIEKAIGYFQQAAQAEPRNAHALAGLCTAYVNAAHFSYRAPGDAFPLAKEAARRALELDPDLAEAHAAMAMVQFNYEWDWPAAERSFLRAIELNPSFADAYSAYSRFLSASGRHEESVEQARRALELDPLSLAASTVFGSSLSFAGRHDEAIEQFQRALELDPNYLVAHACMAAAYVAQERFEKAIDILKRWNWTRAHLCAAHALGGEETTARAILEEITDPQQAVYFSSYDIGYIYFCLGDYDNGFLWFDKAFAERDNRLLYAKQVFRLVRQFEPLVADPRWKRLLERLRQAP